MIDREKLFVRIGLDNKYLTEAQVKQAVDFQAKQRGKGRDLSVGEALMEQKLLNKVQYLAIQRTANYKVQRSEDKVLARILIESDYAAKPDVLASMQFQKDHYGKDGVCRALGDILIERGQLSVEQLKAANKIRELKGSEAE